MSLITRGGKSVRPSFAFQDHGTYFDYTVIAAQLLESLRNVAEQIRDKQMLQCDVRDDIRKMRIALEKVAHKKARKKKGRR